MLQKPFFIITVLLAVLTLACNNDVDTLKTSHSTQYDVQVDSLLKLMTFEEKLGQLNLPGS
jgi:beta-glucosidase